MHVFSKVDDSAAHVAQLPFAGIPTVKCEAPSVMACGRYKSSYLRIAVHVSKERKKRKDTPWGVD